MSIGDDFKLLVDTYIRKAITGGVPSLFSDLKALYEDSSKRGIIEEIVLQILAEEETTTPGELTRLLNARSWSLTFLSVLCRARTTNNSAVDFILPGPALRYFAKHVCQSN